MKTWLIKQQITISFQPTQVAQLLLEEPWPEDGVALKRLRAAGDRLTIYPTRFYPFRLYNLYGPTEDTVWTTWTEVGENSPGTEMVKFPPIGKPAANKQVYILSRELKLQPMGVMGELCIAGMGLARGYLNNPGLTAEKFFPVSSWYARFYISHISPMSHIYRTGDLARWLPDGNIQFLGRIDHQLKIRGYRIELGEIENRLKEHPEIKGAAVISKGEEKGDIYLCAYIVCNTPGMFKKTPPMITALKDFLARSLPDYMIPAYFTEIEQIPLTPNGKIDERHYPNQGWQEGKNIQHHEIK